MQNDTKKGKRRGALLSALVVGGFMAVLILGMLALYFFSGQAGAVAFLLLLYGLVCLAVIIGVCVALLALKERFREMEGGK